MRDSKAINLRVKSVTVVCTLLIQDNVARVDRRFNVCRLFGSTGKGLTGKLICKASCRLCFARFPVKLIKRLTDLTFAAFWYLPRKAIFLPIIIVRA